MQTVGMTMEINILGWSVLLCLAQIGLQSATMTAEKGFAYNASARDGDPTLKSVYAQRLARALRNFLETYPAFIGLALALAVTGKSGGAGVFGAELWFVCRILYIPLYAFGVPYLRGLVWLGSIVGLINMLTRLLG